MVFPSLEEICKFGFKAPIYGGLKLAANLQNGKKEKKGLKMQEIHINARESLEVLKKAGITLTEYDFSKHKKNGIFRTYQVENSKRDHFIAKEILEDYFGNILPRSEKEEKIFNRYQVEKKEDEKHREIIAEIDKQFDIIKSPKEITFEMFKVDQLEDDYKEDDFKIFRCEISGQNDINLHIKDLSIELCKELEKKYSSFMDHPLELDMLKILAEWIIYPKEFAENLEIDLIED